MQEREKLKALINNKVIKRQQPSNNAPSEDRWSWIFDFRAVLLVPKHLMLIIDHLWEMIKEYDRVQVGGLESASIPIVTALTLKGRQEGKQINGFYIRKSRKKTGLYKQIEGTLNDDPIVLVDDLINTASSIRWQVEVLETLKKKIVAAIAVVRFREEAYYIDLKERGISVKTIFTLGDFDLQPDEQTSPPRQNPYQKKWVFSPDTANHMYIVPHSTPAVDERLVYFGDGTGYFYALDKKSGEVAWQFKTGRDVMHKNIFSSPSLYNDMVLFGSYDGTCYALDKYNGGVVWTFTDCECVGSSPSISSDLGLVFIGLEHGLPGRHGSVAALDVSTGTKKWEHDMKAFTHASPLYIEQHNEVCCGGNEGVLYLFDAQTGLLKWKFETEGGQYYPGIGGFSKGDIKLAPVYDEEADAVAFSSMDGYMYVLERKSGALRFRAHTDYYDTNIRSGIFGSPLFVRDTVIFAGLDKHLYCHDKKNGTLRWKFAAAGRIFATPATYNGTTVFIGANDGRLYELDARTGKHLSTTQFPERITNSAVFDPDKTCMYIMTNDTSVHAHALTK